MNRPLQRHALARERGPRQPGEGTVVETGVAGLDLGQRIGHVQKTPCIVLQSGPSERLGAAVSRDALGAAVLVALDQRVRGMVMDGLEILALDHVRLHALLAVSRMATSRTMSSTNLGLS